MKSTVEKLSPTRVRINVEVPFAELEPDYRQGVQAARQAGPASRFPPGQGSPQAAGGPRRSRAVLEQVVNDALPARYSEAITAESLQPIGQPEIEVTKLEDNDELVFTAEVDIRPEIDLPDLAALKIEIDSVSVTDEDVDAEVEALQKRFGTLTGVERAAEDGDFVSIDLSATVDGKDVPEAKTEGLSHEIGSGQLIEGLDEAIIGLKDDESKAFTTTLVAGEHAGQEAEVTVTVKSVKVRELPELDDDFAQLASEFDTIEELRSDLREKVKRVKTVQQAEAIRDKAIEVLLEQTEIPLPEAVVQAQVDDTLHNAIHGLDHDEDKFADQLKEQGSSREEFDTDNRGNAEKAIKTQLLMDAIADKLNIQVGQNDLSERLVLMSRQYGLEPQQLLQMLQQNNQLPAMFADVRRGLTVAAVVHAATVTDSDGTAIDTTEFFGPSGEAAAAEADESPNAGDDTADDAADDAGADAADDTADDGADDAGADDTK